MPPSPPSRFRGRTLLAGKALLAILLVGWLVRGGNLDLKALRIFFDRPVLLAMDLGLFAIGAVVATVRFSVLLRLANVEARIATLFRLQMTAFFFNVVIPGNVGGDVVKALYVARGAAREARTTILLVAFVERLLGLASLVILGGALTLALPGVWTNADLKPLAGAVATLGGLTLFGGAFALWLVRHSGERLEALTQGSSKIARLLASLIRSARLMASGPKHLIIALILSMIPHALAMGLFTVITTVLLGQNVPYASVATIFPLGLLTLILPISPAGVGVGHVAFDRLFRLIGLASGATVFNVYLLGQIAPCLLGVFWFLSLKREGALPTELPAESPLQSSESPN
jgi:uncharacterized protein (TIRG00374 family)